MKAGNILGIVMFSAVLAFATSALSQVRQEQQNSGSDHNSGSGNGQHNPGNGQHNPGTGQHNPDSGQHNPGSGHEKPNPGSGQHNPGSGQHNPGSGHEKPNPGTGQPNPGISHNPNPYTAHYGSQHGSHNGQKWDKQRWESSWNRHWYHHHPVWQRNGWYWWDPTVSRYEAYQQGVTLPEDEYVQAYSQPTAPTASGAPIRILNPAGAPATLSYAINGDSFQIRPGESQSLPADGSCVIVFDRGNEKGSAQYTLQPGQQYQFASNGQGWDLQQMQAP
jgi:hypothetical protein